MDLVVMTSLVGFSIVVSIGASLLLLVGNGAKLRQIFWPALNRVDVKLPLVIETPQLDRYLTTTANISETGALIELPRKISKGTPLKIRLPLGGKLKMTINAVAVRNDEMGVAVQFHWKQKGHEKLFKRYFTPMFRLRNQHYNHLA